MASSKAATAAVEGGFGGEVAEKLRAVPVGSVDFGSLDRLDPISAIFGKDRDLLHLRDAAGAPGVGLHHVHQFFLDQLAQPEDGGHALACSQRNVGGIADAAVTVQVVWRDRVFHEEQLVGF